LATSVFIAGTDTGVGKTALAAGLLCYLRRSGIDAAPMKPAQTGTIALEGRLTSPDLIFCLDAAGIKPTPEELQLMNPYCFELACSPHLAAKIAGCAIDMERIVASFRQLSEKHECVIVEGSGGVLVPINESHTMLDLIVSLILPVIVVARSGLGTINHTLLTLKELKSNNVEVLGVILNETQPNQPDFIARDNAETIRRLGDTEILGSISPMAAEPGANLSRIVGDVFQRSVHARQTILNRVKTT
jgi:dethiobiotin synthetase